jgi:hypothetical protein
MWPSPSAPGFQLTARSSCGEEPTVAGVTLGPRRCTRKSCLNCHVVSVNRMRWPPAMFRATRLARTSGTRGINVPQLNHASFLTESRWDFKYLGLQDESRHFAFGNLSLWRCYEVMPEHERHEREDFAFEVCACMRGRVFPVAAWETIGLPVNACMTATRAGVRRSGAQKSAFNRAVPALKAAGLLSDRIHLSAPPRSCCRARYLRRPDASTAERAHGSSASPRLHSTH